MDNFIQKLKKIKIPFFSGVEVYFDFGTSKTRIAIKDKGIVLRQATFLGYNSKIKDYIFFGNEAKSIIGKTPEFLKIIRPITAGVISDFDCAVALLKRFLDMSVHIYFANYIIKPPLIAVAAIPTSATEIEQKALEETLIKSGVSSVFIIEKPLAAATGCNINVFSHQPNLIVDLGGGLIEISIVGSGGIVACKTIKNAGEYMNKLIANYIYLKYGLILGEATAELLKTELLNFENNEKTITIRGKSLETGLPKSVKIKSSDIKEALMPSFYLIIDGVKELIETSPPEILDELLKKGIILTGGLANIKGIDNFFSNELKINVYHVENPDDVVINGVIKLSSNFENILKLALR